MHFSSQLEAQSVNNMSFAKLRIVHCVSEEQYTHSLRHIDPVPSWRGHKAKRAAYHTQDSKFYLERISQVSS